MAMVGVLASSLSLVTPSAAAAPPPLCEPLPTGGPMFVTEACTDPILDQPQTDLDEQRTLTDPETNVTVTFRYIHGGFTGTNAKFGLYCPDAATYQGRFFQSTYPTVGQEDADPNAAVLKLGDLANKAWADEKKKTKRITKGDAEYETAAERAAEKAQ